MRARWMAVLGPAWLVGAVAGCAPGEDEGDVGRPEAEARVDADVGADADAEAEADVRTCASHAECDDGIACTQDTCRAGGTCGNTPVDGLCPSGQRCSPTVGCTSGTCTTHAECADGVFCDGVERCLGGGCFDGPDEACDDGSVCTDDRCDAASDRCVHDWVDVEGCEVDGGDVSTPFDPLVHYSGEFWLAPPQTSSCMAATYTIETVRFERTAARLTVRGPPCALVQEPPPDGADFSVTCTQSGCGVYTLAGAFSDANNFAGSWSAVFSGGCGLCSPQYAEVIGVRR